MISLPNLSPDGYRLLVYRLRHTDPSKVHFGEATKGFCMFNDVQISEDGPINGYVVIFDMKGVRLGHLAKVQFGPLRTFMNYIQEAHPVRLKKIYIVHTASFINQIMALVRPLIKSELLGLLKFTTNGPSEFFGPEYLPEVSIYRALLFTIFNHIQFEHSAKVSCYQDSIYLYQGSIILNRNESKQTCTFFI